MRVSAGGGLAITAALLLSGCAAGAGAGSPPTWLPKPSFQGEGTVANPQPSTAPSLPSLAPSSAGPTQPVPSGSSAADPSVVATNLTSPVGLVIMPDGTALVGERTTGRILRVQPVAGQPVQTVRTISGIDPSGGGGLLDLALSPDYQQDGLIFAYLSTRGDNRVVDFTLTGPVTPVLTGIPHGATGNAGRIAFGDDGDLYVGTGDAGSPALAANPASLAGKILRVTTIGKPAPGNPVPTSPVVADADGAVAGLCLMDDGSDTLVDVSPDGRNSTARVGVVSTVTRRSTPAPIATTPAGMGDPGGCTVLDSALYVTSLQGRALIVSPLTHGAGTVTAGMFVTVLRNTYGRVRTVVAAPDGALWLTTSNRDGHGTPVPTDERVLRILPAAGLGPNYPG